MQRVAPQLLFSGLFEGEQAARTRLLIDLPTIWIAIDVAGPRQRLWLAIRLILRLGIGLILRLGVLRLHVLRLRVIRIAITWLVRAVARAELRRLLLDVLFVQVVGARNAPTRDRRGAR